MPSTLYSTTCYIKNAPYRLRIHVDDNNEDSENIQLATDSFDFTATDIPINKIKPSLTRLHFELLTGKKPNNNNIPETIILNHLLNVKQTVSKPKKYNSNNLQTSSLNLSDRSPTINKKPVLEQSQETNHTASTSQINFKRRQFSFGRIFSSLSTPDSESSVSVKTLIKINYVDVSNSIRWNTKSLELEMDTEDIANELYGNLNLCLSTLKQRPHRLLAFVNPLSGKGMGKLFLSLLSINNIKLRSHRRVNKYTDTLPPIRELRAHVFFGPNPRKVKNLGPGPIRPRPGVFFHQYPAPCVYIDK
jgi:hypothetical protein